MPPSWRFICDRLRGRELPCRHPVLRCSTRGSGASVRRRSLGVVFWLSVVVGHRWWSSSRCSAEVSCRSPTRTERLARTGECERFESARRQRLVRVRCRRARHVCPQSWQGAWPALFDRDSSSRSIAGTDRHTCRCRGRLRARLVRHACDDSRSTSVSRFLRSILLIAVGAAFGRSLFGSSSS